MCKSPLHPFLAALPKCEHHIHIEGTLEPELLFTLAAKNNITLPSSPSSPNHDPAFASPSSLRARYANFSCLDDFLGYYYIAMSCLLTASDFEALAYAYFAKAASQNVRHAEVFFDPQAHTDRGVALEDVVAGLSAAKARAQRDFSSSSTEKTTKMTIEFTLCILKHLPPPAGLSTLSAAVSNGYFADGTLLGLGMDSSELPFPPSMWADLYAAAAPAEKTGIRHTTIHAGEEGPAGYVRDALDLLKVGRIDHGIRALEDEELVERLVREKVLLTTCPLSNVRLRCVDTLADFPIRELLKRGIRFSVNSDDPAYFGGYVLENYCALQEVFGEEVLGVREWETIARNSVEGSWCGEERKAELMREIGEVVAAWK